MKVQTIDTLLKELEMGTGLDGYMGLMNEMRIPLEEVLPYCTWNKKRYTRNLIERTSQFEILAICWDAGQQSPIHSYGDEQGWMYVVDGELVVNHYFRSYGEAKMQFYKEVHLQKGRFLYVNDYLGFHSVANASKGRTVSLHLHAGPVSGWRVYDENNNAFFDVKTAIDSEGKLDESPG
jgi:cysteine dioxygenase